MSDNSRLTIAARILHACTFTIVLSITACAQDSDEALVRSAVAAAPAEYQDGAKVLAFNEDGTTRTVREGANGMICLADKPGDERFHVACYMDSLEPFMRRGRELRAEGKDRTQVAAARLAEIEAGTLSMPEGPAALYSISGDLDIVDPETGEVSGGGPLYVVYVPYATPETTGLSTTATPGVPWLMAPGEPWAHIMVMPKRGS